MKRILIVCIVFLALAQVRVSSSAEEEPIAPNVELQDKIDRAAKAIATPSLPRWERFREAEKLRPDFEKAPKAFGEQLLYYMTQPHDISRGMAALSLFVHLHTDKRRAMELLLPYIECNGPLWRQTIWCLLGWIEDSSGNRPPDFVCYENLLRENAKAPPAALVRHMFRRDASAAMGAFLNVSPAPPAPSSTRYNDELRWADYIIHDAIRKRSFLDAFSRNAGRPPDAVVKLEELSREEAQRQLERLSKSKEWWVRVYAAEIMQQHGALYRPELIRKLAKDENALVRQATGEVLPRPKPKPSPPSPPRLLPSTKEQKK